MVLVCFKNVLTKVADIFFKNRKDGVIFFGFDHFDNLQEYQVLLKKGIRNNQD